MTDITYNDVAAAARHFEDNKQEPTVRLVRKYLGADNNKVAELMRVWKEARQAKKESKIQVNPAIGELIVFQIEAAATQATEQADQRARAAMSPPGADSFAAYSSTDSQVSARSVQ